MKSGVAFLAVIFVLLGPGLSPAQDDREIVLDIGVRALTDVERETAGIKKGGCVVIYSGHGGGAPLGLQVGDILLKCNGQDIEDPGTLLPFFKRPTEEKKIVLSVLRSGRQMELSVAVAVAPRKVEAPNPHLAAHEKALGAKIRAKKGRSYIMLPEEAGIEDRLSKLKALEENDRWLEAAEEYQSLMTQMADKALKIAEGKSIGIREWCENVIRESPRRLRAYRERFDKEAERLYSEAQADGELRPFRALVENFALSSCGEKILMTAAMTAMEQGRHDDAAALFERLRRHYPESRALTSTVYPSILICARQMHNRRGIEEIQTHVSNRHLDQSSVSIARQEETLSSFAQRLLDDVDREGDYLSVTDSFFPKRHRPALQAWSWTHPVSLPSFPSEYQGEVLLADREGASRIDLKDGRRENGVVSPFLPMTVKSPGTKPWEMKSSASRLRSNILYHGNSLYLCYDSRDAAKSRWEWRLCKIDVRTGSVQWTTTVGYVLAGGNVPEEFDLSAFADRIYVSTNSARIYALDVFSGAILWAIDYPSIYQVREDDWEIIREGDQSPKGFVLLRCPIVATRGIALAFPDDTKSLLAIDIMNGSTVWSYPVKRSEAIFEGLSGSKILLSQRNGVVALDLSSGAAIWKSSLDETPSYGKGAITGDSLYLPKSSGIYRVNLENGKSEICHRWKDADSEAGSLMFLQDKTISVTPSRINCFVIPRK